MTGLDCNILVQLALQDHPANAATISAVQAEVKRGSRLVFPSLVINEFLHVITDACVNNLDHPCSFDQLILRDENQNAAQTKAALQN